MKLVRCELVISDINLINPYNIINQFARYIHTGITAKPAGMPMLYR